MLLSLITAWVAAICVLLTAMKYLAKKNPKVNKVFHRLHIPLGIALIAAGLLHGILAGNAYGTALSEAEYGQVLFSLNLGTVCLVLAVLLGLTYLFRKALKKRWMKLHHVLTVLLLLALVLHVAQVGISLPGAILRKESSAQTVAAAQNEAAAEEETVDVTLPEFSGAVLKDGTYEGSAEGFKGTIAVSVTVSGGAVTDIEITESRDTPKFFEQAKAMLDKILNGQTLEVDAVSGATYSSKGIQEAVYQALLPAVESGELQIKEITVSAKGGRH